MVSRKKWELLGTINEPKTFCPVKQSKNTEPIRTGVTAVVARGVQRR